MRNVDCCGDRYRLTLKGPFAMFSTILEKTELCEVTEKFISNEKCEMRNWGPDQQSGSEPPARRAYALSES
jgi:hypothetical protein